MGKSVKQRRIEKQIRKTEARKHYLRQRVTYLRKRREGVTPRPKPPEVRPIPTVPAEITRTDEDVPYIDIQYSYRPDKRDSSGTVRKATRRIWGATRDTFDANEYESKAHLHYARNGGAAWNAKVIGSGKARR